MKSARLASGLSLLKWVLAATVITFALASWYVSINARDRGAAMQKISRYEVAWTIGQAVNEFTRFEHRLAAFAVPGSDVPAQEVQLRLDIIFSRLLTFEQTGPRPEAQRSLRLFFESNPANQAALVDLRKALEAVDPIVASIDTMRRPEELLAALKILSPLDEKLTALASSASSYAASQVEADQRELQNLNFLSSALATVFIVCGFLLIILLVYHNTLLSRTQMRSRDLADQLTSAFAVLRLQNARFDGALNNMPQALCVFDGEGKLAVFNERFREITGFGSSLAVGLDLDELLRRSSASFQTIFAKQAPWIDTNRTETAVCDVGEACFAIQHSPLPDGGWLATYEDISERRRAMDQIVHMAHHDALTDLPNRIQFNEQLRSTLALPGGGDQQVALFLLDLDNFKDVNDTLGHAVGDQLLQVIGSRLTAFVGAPDRVSRISGDEFATFSNLGGGMDAIAYANALIHHLSRPYHVDGNEIIVGVSIGVALSACSETIDPQELFRRADLALYQAKDEGRGRASLFEPSMDDRLQQRKRLELDLAHALERGEMALHYQPIMDTRTRRPVGYEALLRWSHPELGFVSPATFIPVAERTGIIFELGAWVLEQACIEAASWAASTTIAVNLSAIQFRDNTLVESVADVLGRTGLSAARLELEITESVLLDATEPTLVSLKRLKALGVQIAMDDFGTGYSSLSSLRSFPFDKIKIDRSFVKDLPASEDARAVVDLIVQLGRLLNMNITAEGVETEAQFESLRAMSCTQVQGFLFDRPGPITQLRPEHQPPRSRS